MSRIFIDRPIFAWVIAIIVMLGGLGGIKSLPIEQFPDIAPPQVMLFATYPGASAEALESSVTQVIEQQITGVDNLLYFSSIANSQGQVIITATFAKGTNPDIAQVQIQNKVDQAMSRLPQIVQQQGVRVVKSTPDQLLVVGFYDETGRSSFNDVADYNISHLQEALGRVPGVGNVFAFGSQYAMRIWLDPNKLAAFSLMPSDVVSAVSAQNVELAAGEVGGLPAVPGQVIDATITARSRMTRPEQFAAIVLKSRPDGGIVRLSDVARVEMGAENYTYLNLVNNKPGSAIAISLAPGADALETARLVKAEIESQARHFPPGMRYEYANDATLYINKSMKDVVITLIEAIVLVVIVIFLFLQSWRATLIPAIAVPVVLLGTFGILAIAGYSINTLTLFGLVLAIGLLVDDAIVVVENVERLMHENPGMTPREATRQSMKEIQVALVAIALVLSAVFMPMAFFGGTTGVIYRQFSLTIVSAMVLSVGVALILSPALTATLLRRREEESHGSFVGRASYRLHLWFEARFARLVAWYHARALRVAERKKKPIALYAIVCVLLVGLFLRLPTGFLPSEDQGYAFLLWQLPGGASLERAHKAQYAVVNYALSHEGKNIQTLVSAAGSGGQGTSAQNSGSGFIGLTDWDARKGAENTSEAIARRITKAMAHYRDAEFYVILPALVRGLGQSAGFTAELINDSGMPRDRFVAVRDRIIAEARADPKLTAVRLTVTADQPKVDVDIDTEKLAVLGVAQNDVNSTMSTAWGGLYVNDFVDRGRIKRVYVQGDAPFRSTPDDIAKWQVRNSSGGMVPFSAFSRTSWSTGPNWVTRFNGVQAFEINGQAAPGSSSGEAMAVISDIVARHPGVSVQWSGASYQERLSTGQGPYLYALSIIVVFLCLAALYESWSIPVAVLLVIPLGLFGAVTAVTLRGLQNDIYLQIGLLTTMGLAAKNAILMIEFAEQEERKGKRIIEAAMEAARIRLRPILMTSSSFIFGVMPLALAHGAGANSRIAIGTAVIGGMLTATVLAVFYIPVFFVIVRRTTREVLKRLRDRYLRRHPEASRKAEASGQADSGQWAE